MSLNDLNRILAFAGIPPLLPGAIPRQPYVKLPKYAFSEEEREKLAGLSGKEKKQYLKELKAKYV